MMQPGDYLELVRMVAHEQARLSSSACFFTGEDRLRVSTFNAQADVALAIDGRFVDPTGRVQAFAERHVPNTDRTVATSSFSLGEGFLLGVQLRASAGAPRIGQCFAILEVVRGQTGAVVPLATLLQGYVTDTQRLAWPGSPIRSSVDGPGVLRSITGADPAAGAEIVETVPTNARWRVLAVRFALTTDATVANREVEFVMDDGAIPFAHVPSGFTQVASLTIPYSLFHHAPRNTPATATEKNLPLPRVDLQGGMRFGTSTANIQAGDNYSPPQMLVEEWIED